MKLHVTGIVFGNRLFCKKSRNESFWVEFEEIIGLE